MERECEQVLAAIFITLSQGKTTAQIRFMVSDIGGNEFIYALESLQRQGMINGAEIVYGGDDLRPIEAIWDDIYLTPKGLDSVKSHI